MRKFIQRRWIVAWFIASGFLFYFGSHFLWQAITHKGSGVWTFGGDEPGTGGQLGSDEYQAVISGGEYKRQCEVNACMFFVIGGLIVAEAIRRWKDRTDCELTWQRMITHPKNIQDMKENPDIFRDDFKQWVKENHPELLEH